MARLEFHHVAWAKVEPERHRFSLAGSGVSAPDLAALGLPHQVSLPRDGYGDDLMALERAIAERIEAPGGRVLVTAGASEALACAFGGFVGPGDEVLVETPGYEPHRSLAAMFGATLSTFERRRERGFAGFVPAVEAALTPATRLVVVSQLHNPSGVALDERDLAALDALAERRGFLVLCDETFRDLAGSPLRTLANLGPRWITTSSLTKAYGLGGLRIGWVAGGAPVLDRCAAAHNGLSADPSHPSMRLALALMPNLDRLLERTQDLLARNRALWSAFRERCYSDRFDPGVPSLGTTVWCRFANAGEGDAFAELASRRHELAVTPGRFFGDSRGIRIGLGPEPEVFATALAQMERALQEFVTTALPSGATA